MINLPFFSKRIFKMKPVVLVIMDGFGIAPPSEGNAISRARKPNYDYFWNNYPHTELIASGESVGLPANEVGNTEVGHLTMGAGRVILQDLKRIDLSIERGTFFDNKAMLEAVNHVKSNSSNLHVMGLVSSGNVHSSLEHLYAILQFCKKEEVANVYLHLFTDGRDAPPKEGVDLIEKITLHLERIKVGKIASISGRYYAMDRDRRWARTEKAYKTIVLGQGIYANSALEAVKSAYLKGQTDEFIEPTAILENKTKANTVNDNDAIIFFNYRIDRPRQLTMAFVLPNFENLRSFDFGYDPETSKEEGEIVLGPTFQRVKLPKNLFFVTMTEYQKNLPVSAVAFSPEQIVDPIAELISKAGLRQLRMAESEKERFVTYYFDGLREKPLIGEDVLIVPSPKVATYDKKPEMSLPKLVSEFKKQLQRDLYSFVVINFANPDMVAHTGNLKSSIIAIEITDKYLGELVKTTISQNGTVFITADHGNAEELLTFPTSTFYYTSAKGSINTEHSNNPVPLIIVAKDYKSLILPKGALADISPTILKLFNIPTPEKMTGKNLLEISTVEKTVLSNN